MKAVLEFDLPEEQSNFENAVDGWKWKHFAWQLDQHLRSNIKYNDKLTEEQHNVYADIRKHLYELLNEDGLILD